MAWPESVVTRQISFGRAVILETGADLNLKAITRASRSLISLDDGYRLESHFAQLDSADLSGEVVFELPVTDQPGWLDAATRQVIEVGGAQHSHTYTTTLTVFLGTTRLREYTIGPYPLPSGAGVLDGDTMLVPSDTDEGVLVPIPELWHQIIADAQATLAALPAALSSPAADVALAGHIGHEGGVAREALLDTFGTEARLAQFDIRDYGAKVDGRELTDVSMTGGSNILSSPSYQFVAADVGKVVGVETAGVFSTDYSTNANDGKLISTIQSVVNGNAILAHPAVQTTTAGCVAVFGTPDDDAMSAAQNAAVAAGGGTVFFPSGRAIATRPLVVKDFISWAGVHRDVSWVEVIFSAPGTGPAAAGQTDWLSCAGRNSNNEPLTGASFHDFGVQGRFHIRPGGYTAPIKVLNIYRVRRCQIYRMNVWNSGATSIPFDHSYEFNLIAYNVIKNPGRLFNGSAGGSGIGIGTHNNGSAEPGLIIGNVILGVGAPGVDAKGNNGIFLEAQSSSDPNTPSQGYRIVNNYVQGMHVGIADEGSSGTIIEGNVIKWCETNYRIGDGGVGGAYPGVHTLLSGNLSIGALAPADPSAQGSGILVTSNASDNVGIRAKIIGNTVLDSAGRAIRVNAGTNPVEDVEIVGNTVRGSQRSGIYVGITTGSPADVSRAVIADNHVSQHGLAGVANDAHGIYVAANMVDPVIQNNRVYGANGFRIGGTGALSGDGLVQGNRFPSVVLDGTIASSVRVVGNKGWPVLDTDSVIWVGATELADILGSTTVGNSSRVPHRAFPDAGTTITGAVVPIPTDWATFNVQVVWTSAVGSSGDVHFRGDVRTFADVTDALTSNPPAGTEVKSATMADGSVQVKNLATGIAGSKPFCLINLARIGGANGDTSVNPALVLGVRLIRTA